MREDVRWGRAGKHSLTGVENSGGKFPMAGSARRWQRPFMDANGSGRFDSRARSTSRNTARQGRFILVPECAEPRKFSWPNRNLLIKSVHYAFSTTSSNSTPAPPANTAGPIFPISTTAGRRFAVPEQLHHPPRVPVSSIPTRCRPRSRRAFFKALQSRRRLANITLLNDLCWPIR